MNRYMWQDIKQFILLRIFHNIRYLFLWLIIKNS
jgi:hypothetical protein